VFHELDHSIIVIRLILLIAELSAHTIEIMLRPFRNGTNHDFLISELAEFLFSHLS
jgi:hypothetical protein